MLEMSHMLEVSHMLEGGRCAIPDRATYRLVHSAMFGEVRPNFRRIAAEAAARALALVSRWWHAVYQVLGCKEHLRPRVAVCEIEAVVEGG